MEEKEHNNLCVLWFHLYSWSFVFGDFVKIRDLRICEFMTNDVIIQFVIRYCSSMHLASSIHRSNKQRNIQGILNEIAVQYEKSMKIRHLLVLCCNGWFGYLIILSYTRDSNAVQSPS